LATYGTLAPGRPNHDQLAGLAGRWLHGHVHGTLIERGFPALLLDPNVPALDVQVFESPDLPAHWPRLDEFEGSGYDRMVTTVHTPDGDLPASIYVLRQAQPAGA
jgi:gamma-glutamylcyclotransferase (GGCT)/AIG2-like uncharacterized protein YtfP